MDPTLNYILQKIVMHQSDILNLLKMERRKRHKDLKSNIQKAR